MLSQKPETPLLNVHEMERLKRPSIVVWLLIEMGAGSGFSVSDEGCWAGRRAREREERVAIRRVVM